MDLYPNIDDPDFQTKIADKQEFRQLYSPDGLHAHQEFVRRFLSPFTPYKCLLLFHALGSGKSFACIAVAVDRYIHYASKCMVVTKGESGRNNFVQQVDAFHIMSTQKHLWNTGIFFMRRYIALSNYLAQKSDDELCKQFSGLTIIFDEIHNVSSSSVSMFPIEESVDTVDIPLDSVGSANVLEQLQRLLRNAKNITLILCTATPMTDSPDQLRSILALCNTACKRPDLTCMKGIISYNNKIENRPEPVFEGECYDGVKLLMSEMIDHQRSIYISESGKGTPNDIYRALTHISLFCTPPSLYGRQITDNSMHKSRIHLVYQTNNGERKVTYLKFSPKLSLQPYLHRKVLASSSAKYSKLLDLLDSNEKAFVFVEEVQGSGILLLAAILECNGYQMYAGEHISTLKRAKRFTICVGRSDICPNIEDRLQGFNCPANNTGEYVQILVGSKVISESISLLNVKQFHSMTPHWNHSTIDQAIGRVVRSNSHLYSRDKTVKLYRHAAYISDAEGKHGVDIDKINTSISKQKQIDDVRDQLIQHAVDKMCNPAFADATDFSTFAAIYTKYYIDDFVDKLSSLFSESRTVSLSALSGITGKHRLVCNEAVASIITRNIPLAQHTNAVYMRIYGNTLFTVHDPSLSFVTLQPLTNNDVGPMGPSDKHLRLPPVLRKDLNIVLQDINSGNVFRLFRYWPVVQKILFVEDCISNKKLYLLDSFSHVYCKNTENKLMYHFMYYKNLTTAYTSCNPTPKIPKGKTRYFDGNNWSFLADTETEKALLAHYHDLIETTISTMSAQYQYVGIISTIDGKMRLRLRQNEDRTKSQHDLRYVMRGKYLQSINKERLQNICASVCNLRYDDVYSFSIAELAESIDAQLVSMGRYLII